VVFRVRGHLLKDLWRFETVYLTALGVNFVLLPLLVQLGHLPVLLAQALIMVVTSVMSWVGHKHYSFRRTSSSGDLPQ
jgi:putative flippase GtrA